MVTAHKIKIIVITILRNIFSSILYRSPVTPKQMLLDAVLEYLEISVIWKARDGKFIVKVSVYHMQLKFVLNHGCTFTNRKYIFPIHSNIASKTYFT